MAPTADLLPEPKKWRPVHAVLEWTVLEDETLQVSGFGGVGGLRVTKTSGAPAQREEEVGGRV